MVKERLNLEISPGAAEPPLEVPEMGGAGTSPADLLLGSKNTCCPAGAQT